MPPMKRPTAPATLKRLNTAGLPAKIRFGRDMSPLAPVSASRFFPLSLRAALLRPLSPLPSRRAVEAVLPMPRLSQSTMSVTQLLLR